MHTHAHAYRLHCEKARREGFAPMSEIRFFNLSQKLKVCVWEKTFQN